jgi:hypothetical protein
MTICERSNPLPHAGASVNFVVLYTIERALIDAQDLAGRPRRCDWRAR